MGLAAQGNIFSMVIFCGTVVLTVLLAGYLLWAFYRRAVLKRKALQN